MVYIYNDGIHNSHEKQLTKKNSKQNGWWMTNSPLGGLYRLLSANSTCKYMVPLQIVSWTVRGTGRRITDTAIDSQKLILDFVASKTPRKHIFFLTYSDKHENKRQRNRPGW